MKKTSQKNIYVRACGISCIISILSLILSTYVYKETFIGYFENIFIFILNTLPILFIYIFFYCMTKREWISYLISILLVLGGATANYYKIVFRDDPLMFGDLSLIKEAKNLLGNYELFLDYKLVFIWSVSIIILVLLFFKKKENITLKFRMFGIFISIIGVMGTYTLIIDDTIYESIESPYLRDSGNQIEQFSSRGFVYSFIRSISYRYEKPENYKKSEMEKEVASLEYYDIPEEKKINIIAVMLEAYNDFNKFKEVDFENNPYIEWEKLKEESYSGEIVTNIFAGGTIDTERSFITGALGLPDFRRKTDTYITYFDEQGYVTEGVHPYHGWYYNRKNINFNLGFQKYYFYEDIFEPNGIYLNEGKGLMPVISDEILFDTIYSLYTENKKTGKPYLNFSVSLAMHGAYPTDVETEKRYLKWKDNYTEEEYNICNYYFEQVEKTNKAISEFIECFREEEPVVIVFFGDHNPWLGNNNSAYEMLEINLKTDEQEGFYNYYCTPYLFWANNSAKECLQKEIKGEGGVLSACFLMNELFKVLGYKGNQFMQASNQLYETLNVIQEPFYQSNNSVFCELTENERNLIIQFKKMQYYWLKER